MTVLSGEWLSRGATQKAASALSDAGYQVFFVGGCVRNSLLNVAVSDIDMATDALPQTVIDLAQAAGLKAIPTGLEHGTITVVSEGIPHEITTFRTDTRTDGRHADVAFSRSISEDALRRDFTMNALYGDPNGRLYDPVNGLPDLRARKVRFVGDADQRIAEDFLRILRFFRFHAWYGDPEAGLDIDGLAACAGAIGGLATLSRERVGAEMIKMLSAPDPAPAIAAMAQSGILQTVMTGADPKYLAPLVHFEAETPPDWRRRVAVLGGDALRQLWRLSKRDANHLEILRTALENPTSIAEVAYRYGPELARNTGLARAAIFETPQPTSLEHDIDLGVDAKFPIKAADLPDLAGAPLGVKLRKLEDIWISSDFSLSKSELLAL